MPETPHVRRIYKNPPIIERVITVHARHNSETFPTLLEAWKQIVREEFPHYDPRAGWNVTIEEKDGVPSFGEGALTMELRNLWWRNEPKNKRIFYGPALQLEEFKFGVNLVRDEKRSFRFEDVFQIFTTWLPRWAQHFGISVANAVTVEYVNLISLNTFSAFAQGERLNVGQILKVFPDISIPGAVIVPPLRCEVPLRLPDGITGAVRTESVPGGITLQLSVAKNYAAKQPLQVGEAPGVALALHDWMITVFEAVFTDAAKASFDPLT